MDPLSNDNMATPISPRGRFFWQGDERVRFETSVLLSTLVRLKRNQFLVKGVVYRLHGQNAGQDPLADGRFADLERDVTLFQELGLNVLFVGMSKLPKRRLPRWTSRV